MSQPPNDLELVLPDGWRSHPTAPLMVTKGADDRLGALQLSSGAVHAGIPLSGQAADMGTQAKLGVPAERWDGPCAYGLMGEVHLVSKEHADVHLGLACCEGAEPVLFTWISAVVGLWPEVLSIVKSMRVRSGSLGAEAAWLVGSTRSSFEEQGGRIFPEVLIVAPGVLKSVLLHAPDEAGIRTMRADVESEIQRTKATTIAVRAESTMRFQNGTSRDLVDLYIERRDGRRKLRMFAETSPSGSRTLGYALRVEPTPIAGLGGFMAQHGP